MSYGTGYNANYGGSGYNDSGNPPPPQPMFPQQAGYNAQPPPYNDGADNAEHPQQAPDTVCLTGRGAEEWKDVEQSNDRQFAGNSFTDKAIRRRFIRKVCLILFSQLIVTAAIIAFFVLHTPTKLWVRQHRYVYFISYGVFLVTYLTLVCCEKVRRNYPMNIVFLSIFTLAFSYMTAMIASFHNAQAVLIAAGICAVVCLGITIFAIQTKIDFTMCSGLLFCLLLVMILFGFGVMIVYAVGVDNKTRWILQMVYGSLGALVFSLFLAYDIQMLMGGRKYQLSEEEYIVGALQIYLDVVYIFMFIVMMFGGDK